MAFVLRNGFELPELAFGTFNIGDDYKVKEAIKLAIKSGYRHIDTASIYKNEEAIGEAIKEISDIKREELIISGKVWNKDQGYDNTIAAFERSCTKLGVDYLDIYLIHWPVPYGRENDYQELNYSTWCAMMDLYSAGKIKAIGVSNFLPRHLELLMNRAKIAPMLNQIEINPCYHQKDNVEFCKNNNIFVQAWSPFKRGDVFQIEVLKKLANKHNTTVSRICLQWCLQIGVQPMPKASSEKRMEENFGPYGFELDEEDFDIIDALDDVHNHAPFGDYDLQQNN